MTSSNPNIAVKKSREGISNAENFTKDLLEEITSIISLAKSEAEKKKTLDIKEDSVEDANKKMLISLENTLGNFSLQISKQDRPSGPGFIFSKDYKKIHNFDEKCPPVPYCEGFDARFVPESKIFVYPSIIRSYNQTGDVEVTSRSNFLAKTLVLLILQLVVTVLFILVCIYITSLNNFVRRKPLPSLYAFGLGMALFIAILCCTVLRKAKPWNYISLTILTLCTAYHMGYRFSVVGPRMFLYCLGGTLVILTAIGILACVCCIDFTNCFYIIDTLSFLSLIFYIIAVIYTSLTGNRVLIYIFLWALAMVIMLSLLNQFQLMSGKGKYSMQTDEHILSAVLIYFQIILILIILPDFFLNPPM